MLGVGEAGVGEMGLRSWQPRGGYILCGKGYEGRLRRDPKVARAQDRT